MLILIVLFFREQTFVKSPSVGIQSSTFNAKKLWPCKVVLPTNFRPDLMRALASKDEKQFTGKLRKAFISRLFEYFSGYTL